MTLMELRAQYRHLFYEQTPWWTGEAFMRTLPNDRWVTESAVDLVPMKRFPKREKCKLAVDYAHMFVADPENPNWRGYRPCRDLDQFGQRIFVGCALGKGFEIHREVKMGRFKLVVIG